MKYRLLKKWPVYGNTYMDRYLDIGSEGVRSDYRYTFKLNHQEHIVIPAEIVENNPDWFEYVKPPARKITVSEDEIELALLDYEKNGLTEGVIIENLRTGKYKKR